MTKLISVMILKTFAYFKREVHPKKNILSLITHPYVIPKPIRPSKKLLNKVVVFVFFAHKKIIIAS